MFSGKIYTADNNFTWPPVATVATNSKSAHMYSKIWIFVTFSKETSFLEFLKIFLIFLDLFRINLLHITCLGSREMKSHFQSAAHFQEFLSENNLIFLYHVEKDGRYFLNLMITRVLGPKQKNGKDKSLCESPWY